MAKFLGSSIVSFNESADFKGSELSLDVNLVDCSIEGDMFSPPPIGSSVNFVYEDHYFYGIVDRYGVSNSNSAYPQYNVHVTNGLFLVDGVKLILNDYFGTTSAVPNLINVFGFLENSGGFGASEINDAGISWNKVASAVDSILNNPAGAYGGPITYKGCNYGIDISALPAIPNYYRINNGSVSLLEFIQEVCEAGGHDYFIKLELPPTTTFTPLNGIFKLYTISRLNEPTPGAVAEYISSAPCVTQKEIGQELRKDTTSKFVVGANLERMWFVMPSGSGDISGGITSSEYANYTVLPYYGLTINGNYIVGYTPQYDPTQYYFDIDIRDIGHPNLGTTYTTCEEELKAAKCGREAWEIFLAKKSCNKYMMVPESECGAGGITAHPFVFPVKKILPNGAARTQLFGVGSEYRISNYDWILYPVFKYGFQFLKNRVNQKPPLGFLPTDYYDNSVPVSNSFTSTNNCAVNNTKFGGKYKGNLYYPAKTGHLNPYFLRAFKIGNVSAFSIPFCRMFESDLYRLANVDVMPANHKIVFQDIYRTFVSKIGIDDYAISIQNDFNIDQANKFKYQNAFQDKADALYKKLRELADDNFGRKFMVTIPSMYGAIEPESNSLRLSQEPTDTGYLDESVWSTAYTSGLIPSISGVNILLDTNDKFYPFAKINEAVLVSTGSLGVISAPYDFKEISQNSVVFSNPRLVNIDSYLGPNTISEVNATLYDSWIKCSVLPNIVFYDNTTLLGPRAIVELPGQVSKDPTGRYGSVQSLYEAIQLYALGDAGAFREDAAVNEAKIAKILNNIGVDTANFANGQKYITPNLFAVPLKSKTLCYGPWYLAGANGPVVYEKNDDLAPWNYGGFAAMDDAGFSRVTDGVTDQTFDETGSVTIAGTPSLNIGDQLVFGGPYITDISVSVGSDGITTQYSFQSWSSQRRLAKLTNFQGERIKRLTEVSRDLRRAYRDGVGAGVWRNPNDFVRNVRGRMISLDDLPRRDRGTTSHAIMAGQNDGIYNTVVMQPDYNAGAQTQEDYYNKTFMSLDGLFVPYSNLPHSGLSSLVITNTGDINNAHDLYPLRKGTNVKIVTSTNASGNMPEEGPQAISSGVREISGVPDYRGMALRGPVVIQGWGRDTNGDPVPLMVNESGNPVLESGTNAKQFSYDYLYNSKKWKTGPVDFRWNDGLGTWVGGSFINIAIAYTNISATDNIFKPASGYIYDYAPDVPDSTGSLGSKKIAYVFDKSLGAIDSGTLVYYYNQNGLNHIIYAACSPDATGLKLFTPTPSGSGGGGGPLPDPEPI